MALTPPLIVLLGASGFVGSAVLRELATRPVRVRAVSRRPAVVPGDARAEIEVLTVDLCEPGRMAEAVAGADIVIHAVAYIDGVTTWRVADGDSAAERVTVGLVRDLVDVARSGRADGAPPLRVVFTGAASQVGVAPREVLDGTETDRPAGEYDRQKLAAETTLLAAHAEGVVEATSIRLPTVFGSGPRSTARDKGVVSLMVRRAVAGQDITMWHDGTVRRDLVYIDDVARALVAAAEHVTELAGRAWLLGSGHGTPLGEVFATVAELVAAETGKPPVAVLSVPPPANAEAGDFRSVTIDASAFRAVTGWEPRVPLDEALARTVAHCVQEVEPS
ncbi:NAD-dependent epimerase/dehydratase [Actinoplanes oblitus]|uniref:NAD-dependent epimerase/dehydratase n=1 Tax=Actinoplanes oblitus TaxID=3040509 RepID=A0ABY8WBF1_9ACTN|nr:NAD-dependent epimerase/dehydratase [Actinoplanes oblitus]WIM94456.1 NAD-dependent epimerase/dehydratase [Actinoplanes oblitus]